ncbi:MAG: alanine--tRNA ligase [Fimbriimonadales bacterium]|nr:MAG: alanine--tRNA ligase [Fimbriimonadales bacterium]
MHWNARALRQAFLSYFQEKGHLQLPSDSLVPKDPSLLFTSAGMVQFKPYFLGVAQPPATRVVTVQKCLRTTDIDSVGDLSHLTFFEMLGNFSFGDYFKREAILLAWEFLTERLKVDTDRLQFTVFQDDDEAFTVWHREVGIPENRIWRLGEKTNFWPANAITEGPNGPCGPCSEIFYDTRLDTGCTNPNCGPACDCGRWLEIWNLVFMQYERSEQDGKPILTPLPKKNIDTGMGLERTAAVLMGFSSPFETDVFAPIVQRIESLAGVRYGAGEPTDTAIRLIADHIRAATFTIADGVIPQNEGRGYVLRRIIRRAILRGQRVLGFEQPFFADLVPAVVEALGDQYPEIVQRQDYITTTLRFEEERFRHTLQAGLTRLEELLADAETQQQRRLSGERVFMLYDTYGFPLELTQEIAAERGVAVDMQGFEQALEAQRQRAREASGISEKLFVQTGAALAELAQQSAAPTQFIGYEQLAGEAQVVGIIREGNLAPEAHAGETVEVVLNRTPFYAEAGGQVGDTGTLEWHGGRAQVLDTQKANDYYLHHARIVEGVLRLGEQVHAQVDAERRLDIQRNHTATHLLHAALRQVLGTHVVQAGSLVAPDRLRFDFTHPRAVSPDELERIEALVNEKLLQELEVRVYTDVPIEEARQRGAMMLFGEKYGERVRMVEIPGFSLELCGGTHLRNTVEAGLFKIVHEGSVAAGVRRIEALTGRALYQWLREREHAVRAAAERLQTPVPELPHAVERLQHQIEHLEGELEQLKQRVAAQAIESITPIEVNGVQVVAHALSGVDAKSLGAIADRLIQRGVGVAALGAAQDGKAILVVKVAPEWVQRGLHAGNLIRQLAQQVGGSGGGRPDFAQAGGKQPEKLADALAQTPRLVVEQMRT